MDELGNIMMVKLKMFQFEKMLYVFQITSDQVIHANYMVAFMNEPVAQMRTQKSGCTGDQYPFLSSGFHSRLVG
jgi:hypothetical protein